MAARNLLADIKRAQDDLHGRENPSSGQARHRMTNMAARMGATKIHMGDTPPCNHQNKESHIIDPSSISFLCEMFQKDSSDLLF